MGWVYRRPLPAKQRSRIISILSYGGQIYYKSLAGALSFQGDLATKAIFHQALTGALSFSGALKKKTKKGLSGALSFSGVLRKKTKKTLTGDVSFVGALGTVYRAKQSVAGALTFVGNLATNFIAGGGAAVRWFLIKIGWL